MHFSKVQTLKPLLCTLKGCNQSIPALDEDDKACRSRRRRRRRRRHKIRKS